MENINRAGGALPVSCQELVRPRQINEPNCHHATLSGLVPMPPRGRAGWAGCLLVLFLSHYFLPNIEREYEKVIRFIQESLSTQVVAVIERENTANPKAEI